MACRSRALVCFVREATRSPTWRARSIRGVVTSASALYAHHPTAVVDPRARLAPDTSLGAFCVVSAGAVVGPGCRLGAGVHLLGDVELGARCTILSHAVIGAEDTLDSAFSKETSSKHERTTRIESGCAIGPHVTIGLGAFLGTGSVVGPGGSVAPFSKVGPRCVVEAGARVGVDVRIDEDGVVASNASLRHCDIGARGFVQQNAAIGSDGFGFHHVRFSDNSVSGRDAGAGERKPAPTARTTKKKPQTLRVSIGADCEIGANSAVDRGSWRDTAIGDGTKLDNLVQIGHNARIGRNVLLCGGVAIGGSAVVGDETVMGGKSAARDHVTICAGARIAAKAGVTRDITEKGDYAGYPAVPATRWKREIARRARAARKEGVLF